MRLLIINVALLAATSIGLAADKPATDSAEKSGLASFYSTKMNGHRTASGQRFNSNALTAASKEYPLGTKLKLTNTGNNRSVIVRVNDRGPNIKGRDISVTRRAARQLGFIKAGTAQLTILPVK